MIATLRETWRSITHLDYGPEIIKKSVGQTFWYWFKYPLTFTVVLALLAVFAAVYFTPQLASLAHQHIPDMTINIADGKLTTNLPQPFTYTDSEFTLVVNTQGNIEDIDDLQSGALILEDRVIFKDQTQTRIFNFSDLGQDVDLSKETIVGWLTTNKTTILSIGLVVILVAAAVMLGMYVIWQAVAFLLGGLTVWVVGQVSKRKTDFANSLKLTIYAAVPALLVSILIGQAGGDANSLIVMAVWVFFAIAWLVKLPTTS